ncbi:MAG TPA: hypothetical protein VFI72_04680 [Candidatus Angelobacter sp.]|nr:hypothetical protein [Candidatus Angelobacter sp.]
MQIYRQFASDLLQLLGAATAIRIRCAGYLPLSIEDIGPDGEGRRQISICHYGEQNGDPMRDPEMVFAFHDWGTFLAAEPVSYRNDYMGVDQECYVCDRDGKRLQVRLDLKAQFKAFAQSWFRNLHAQGFFGPNAIREPIA